MPLVDSAPSTETVPRAPCAIEPLFEERSLARNH
jgi:hypothetical protein